MALSGAGIKIIVELKQDKKKKPIVVHFVPEVLDSFMFKAHQIFLLDYFTRMNFKKGCLDTISHFSDALTGKR